MKKIGVFGTSGFAREVGDIALVLGFEPIYVARDQLDADSLQSDGEVILERECGVVAGVSVLMAVFIHLHGHFRCFWKMCDVHIL